MRVAVAQVGGKKAADLRHMHPRQQVGVTGSVRATVSGGADYLQVNGPDLFDQPVGIAAGAEGGARDELAGTAQAPQQVLAKVGMIPDPGQGQGV
ncbi:hypothetical protein D3C77_673500 [compost metagenome]